MSSKGVRKKTKNVSGIEQQGSQIREQGTLNRLGEDIRNHVFSIHVADRNVTVSDTILQEKISDVDVLGALGLNLINLQQHNGGRVVFHNNSRQKVVKLMTILGAQELTCPNDLTSRIRQWNYSI